MKSECFLNTVKTQQESNVIIGGGELIVRVEQTNRRGRGWGETASECGVRACIHELWSPFYC